MKREFGRSSAFGFYVLAVSLAAVYAVVACAPASTSESVGDAAVGTLPADVLDGGDASDAAVLTDATNDANGTDATDLSDAASDSATGDDAGGDDSGVDSGVDPGADATAPLNPLYFDSNLPADDVFSLANPNPAVFDIAALDKMLTTAQAQSTDAIILAQGDTIVVEHYYKTLTGPVTVQSVSKSVISLAIGILIDEGKIASINVPVSTYFSEWSTGAKANVTIAHLLSMTSGMIDDPTGAFFTQSDRLAYARARALTGTLGTFSYTNTGAMLFAGIVQSAAGMAADAFVNDRIFSKIGITDWSWSKDGAGSPIISGGLYVRPRGMLRLGRLVRDGGSWNGTQIVSAKWVADSTAVPSGSLCYSYFWWINRSGCASSTPLVPTPGAIDGFYADGWGGNYIVPVLPKNLLGIRTKDAGNATYNVMRLTAFESFPRDLLNLVP